jgi:hypothetical protein
MISATAAALVDRAAARHQRMERSVRLNRAS